MLNLISLTQSQLEAKIDNKSFASITASVLCSEQMSSRDEIEQHALYSDEWCMFWKQELEHSCPCGACTS